MCPMKCFLILLFFTGYPSLYAQKISENWKTELNEAVAQFKTCKNITEAGIHSCNKYIGNALQLIYQCNDFYAKEKQRYLLAGEIYDYVRSSSRWNLLGRGYEQEALTQAQQQANQQRAVVAVYRSAAGEGHVAYVIPGELQASGSWGLRVPNSAAFFIKEPERSYSHKGLSYSFPRNLIQSVELYERKY